MKGYILNDYERSISIKNLKSIIGTPMYKKLAAGTLRFGASNNGKGERLVLVDSIPLKYMSQEARAAILFCSERMVQPVICAKNKKGPRAYRKERTVTVLSEPAEVIAEIRQLLYQLECQVLKIDSPHLTFLIRVIPVSIPLALEAERKQDIDYFLRNVIANAVGYLALCAMRVYYNGNFK
mgnify:CR=1 FL=1